jgi:hypothetical protein
MNPLDNAGHPASGPPDRAAITAKTRGASANWEKPVYFPEWRAILDLDPLEPHVRARYARAVRRGRHHENGHRIGLRCLSVLL